MVGFAGHKYLPSWAGGRELLHSSCAVEVVCFPPPLQCCPLLVEGTASLLLVPAEPWWFQHLVLTYPCTTERSSLLLFQVSIPSWKGALRDLVCALKLCRAAAHQSQHPWVQCAIILGKQGLWGHEWGFCNFSIAFFYCTCLGWGFFTGNFFPNSYFLFSHVFRLFHHHSSLLPDRYPPINGFPFPDGLPSIDRFPFFTNCLLCYNILYLTRWASTLLGSVTTDAGGYLKWRLCCSRRGGKVLSHLLTIIEWGFLGPT